MGEENHHHHHHHQKKPTTTTTTTTSDSSTQIHVLAVDDCFLDRKIVEKVLKTASFKVTSVDSGEKALKVLGLSEDEAVKSCCKVICEFALHRYRRFDMDCGEKIGADCLDIVLFLRRKKIDIILTDYCKPEMNGYDLLMTVKENNRTKSIPVVIISSEYDLLRINRHFSNIFLLLENNGCLADGAEDFLQKPLQQKDLQKLRSYARPTSPVLKTGTKRKMKLDLIPEGGAAERRPRVAAGVAVA